MAGLRGQVQGVTPAHARRRPERTRPTGSSGRPGRADDDRLVGQPGQRPVGRADDAVDGGSDVPGPLDCGRPRLIETLCSREPPPTLNTSSASRDESFETVEPRGEGRLPSLVVGARGELGDVVGRSVALDQAELAKVVDRVGGVPGAAADAKDEQPTTASRAPRPDPRPWRRPGRRRWPWPDRAPTRGSAAEYSLEHPRETSPQGSARRKN